MTLTSQWRNGSWKPRFPEDEMRPAPTVPVAESRLVLRTFLDPSQNQPVSAPWPFPSCPLALCPHFYLADLNLPCIKMMCVGISLSSNKWTSITCGLVFNLSSLGKFPPGKPSFPLSFVVGNGWLHLQSQGHELMIPPRCSCFREGCTIEAESWALTRCFLEFLESNAFCLPLGLVMWGLELQQTVFYQEGDQLGAEGNPGRKQS